jgi:hypothetical protein
MHPFLGGPSYVTLEEQARQDIITKQLLVVGRIRIKKACDTTT